MEYANGRGVFPGRLADAQVVAALGPWRPEPALPAGWMATSVAGTPRALRELLGRMARRVRGLRASESLGEYHLPANQPDRRSVGVTVRCELEWRA